MRNKSLILAVLLTAVFCTQVAAQGFRSESFPEGSYSPVTNINRSGYPRVLKDIGGGCGAEAIRVVKSMPKWNPGKQSGKAVRVQFNLPVNFNLQ